MRLVYGADVVGRTLAAAVLTLAAALPLVPRASAQEPPPELVVGTFVDPPFAMKTDRGDWHGIAIGLWREIARREGFTFRFVEHDLEDLLAALEAGRVDVAVGPLLITAARERRFDMTSPFMHVSLAIATRPAEAGDWIAAVASSATGAILKAALGLVAAMVFFALLVWLVERRRNPDHFGGERMKGIGDAVWWSASTMTTVGYGDRTPITLWGRTVGIAWMILSIVLVSTFIATVSSTLTLVRLQPQIHSVHDLARVRVGVVEGSGAAEFVAAMHVSAAGFHDVETAMAALAAGELDAVVEEAPVLRYLASTEYEGRISVVTQSFSRGFVAFALPRDGALRHRINIALLEVMDDQAWRELVRKFLGS